MVGRSEEMAAIQAALSGPDASGIVVHAAAGVGKSRLARDALAVAEARGCQGRWTVGTSSARAIPLGAFTTWAPSGVTDTMQLIRGVIDSLTTAASDTATVVLCVDDVHLLDDLSIFVVHQIVQRGTAKALLTVRDGEPIPAAVQEIWQGGHFERLDLQPLSQRATTTLLAATLGGSVDPDAAGRLWRLTRGNVLYLQNIVEQEVADGRLVDQHGHWQWVGDPVLPPGLVELIGSRIGDLPGAVGDVIDALAVGEPVELAALRSFTDPAAVEEADTRGLITLEPGAAGVQVRVAHPLYGEVRRSSAPPTLLRRLRGLVAAALAESDQRDDIQVVVRRATLTLDSDLPPDENLLVKAAHGAVWLADLPLADRLATAALHLGAGPETNFVRAHALSWLGRGEEADAVLTEIDVGQLSDGDRARLAFLRASNALWALCDPARAKKIIDDASRTTPPRSHSYIDAFRTVYWFATDHPRTALRASKKLVLDDLPAVVGAEIAWALSTIAADAGRVATAVDTAEAGYRTATRSFDAPQMRFNIADSHLSALVLAGRVGDATALAERVQRQAADLPGVAQLLGAAVAGRAALAAGDLCSASDFLERAAEGMSGTHASGWGYRYHIPHATALALRGRTDEAAAVLAALDKVHRAFRSLDYEHSLARACLAAGEGAIGTAIGIALDAAQRACAQGQFAAEVLCRQTATQLGDHSGAARLRELEQIVEGPRVGVAAQFAEALCAGDAAQLASASEEFELLGDLVAALDAAAHAVVAYRRQGLRGSVLSCSTRAAALAQRCGANTAALRQAVEPLALTERECQIVMLIGKGLSSREIAGRLGLSVRTVESHIYRAMSKTGTTSRDELAALLPRPR
ncbi:transcriptional regulator [Mycobacterium kiyosense]|uniref:Transcriptional regulator n=1 Tax=Mycobacterium kiyosense TaxID=2871094 RepID=A0A9P3QBV4_9MYCO|nr:transcriptional regulator [Mycobacterium kiyosense]GLD03043.1 transcriptional regulator [Mycobacterium kiyosense]GLD19608.1 transcriptional regulator [Mycobacterium kiyosense]GLD32679.1 transcriptional regulator [Mycobacterium kiyosense]GLD37788.1 transcriptional regulator [Mycobacterium kiyosense]